MTGHWTIMAATLSLGGMASVGVNHYVGVSHLVENHHQGGTHSEPAALEQRMKEMENSIVKKFEEQNENWASVLDMQNAKVIALEEAQKSQSAQLKRYNVEQTELIFKVDTHDSSFRPLRVQGGELRRLEGDELSEIEGQENLLLPPVDGW